MQEHDQGGSASSSRRPVSRAILAIALCASTAPALHGACVGPLQLQARIRSHPGADTYVALGTWYAGQHNFDCANQAFAAGLKLEPASGRLAYLLGLSLYSGGHADQALPVLQRAVQLAPEMLEAHLLLASDLDVLQRQRDALTEWQAAVKIDPKSEAALDGLSKSLIRQGDYASVIANLKPFPHNQDLTLDLALAYGKMGMLEGAASVLEQALKFAPGSLRLTKALVTVMVQQTRTQDALRLAARSAQLHPADPGAQALYARVLIQNGEYETARPIARKLLAASPHSFDALYLNGVLERQAGEYGVARSHLEEAVALNPGDYNVHYNLGMTLVKLQEPAAARKQFERVLALGATDAEVHFDLASVLRSLGETQQAAEQLKIYQEALKDKANRTEVAGKAAEAAQELASGDAQRAASLYKEAAAASPDDAQLGYKLAMALDKAGDLAAERSELERVVKLDPTMAVAQNQLGYLESRSGDTGAAEEHFRAALAAAPGYTQAWVSLAATLGMESRFAEAQQALASALRLDPQNAQAHDLARALNAAQAHK
ncbi:MAG TPA: tetratricopeptide repeat protein [Acidisarcina sp.]